MRLAITRIAVSRRADYHGRMIFNQLCLWMDPVKRPGPEAMAVDEWLLETAEMPVLRVYDWAGDWASIGYFGKLAAARASIPGVEWVRRWTGGGTVDHRAGWTYTLVAPQGEPLASWRGAESYRRIHARLAETLVSEGIVAHLSTGTEETGAALCFENPVGHDLLGADGQKLAGAGQRRSRQGLLHQGSVAVVAGDEAVSRGRAEDLAGRLAGAWQIFAFQPEPQDIARRVAAKYGREPWTARR
jgi:lipoate-protein ligase A